MFYAARFLFCGEHKYLYYTIPCGPLVDSPSQLIIGSLCWSTLTHWQIIIGEYLYKDIAEFDSFSLSRSSLKVLNRIIYKEDLKELTWFSCNLDIENVYTPYSFCCSCCVKFLHTSLLLSLHIEQSCRKYANTCCWEKRHCRNV